MSKDSQDQQRKIWASILQKAWSNKEFKEKLKANPLKVLKEEGFHIEEDMNYIIIEDTKHLKHLIIPKEPITLEEKQLKGLTGGISNSVCACKGIVAGCCVTCGVCACKGIVTCFSNCNPVSGSGGSGGSGGSSGSGSSGRY